MLDMHLAPGEHERAEQKEQNMLCIFIWCSTSIQKFHTQEAKRKCFRSRLFENIKRTLSSLALSTSARKGLTALSPTTFIIVARTSKEASRTSGAESFTCCRERRDATQTEQHQFPPSPKTILGNAFDASQLDEHKCNITSNQDI